MREQREIMIKIRYHQLFVDRLAKKLYEKFAPHGSNYTPWKYLPLEKKASWYCEAKEVLKEMENVIIEEQQGQTNYKAIILLVLIGFGMLCLYVFLK